MANLPTAPQQKHDASSSSASTSYPRYDVFINHRGSDVKNTFASHLYQRLRDHGLWVFLDKPELEPGHEFQSQIEAAIRVAYVQISIFSPAYAESKWCLDELVLMIKSRAPIVPIFYNVEPFEVRWNDKKGVYAEALKKLEQKTIIDPQTNREKPRHDSATTQGWRDALSHVADISGLELKTSNGNEAELLDKVVQSLLKKLPKTPLLVAKYPTGLDDKLQHFESTVLTQQGQERDARARVVGIVGVGGIGKITLVKQIFNRRCSEYDGSSFLSDVSETAARKSLVDLQMKLIKDLTHRDIKIEIVDQGVIILKRYLACCNAMIVLDNVEKADQLDAFLPVRDVLSSNSLIIVTSRDKHALLCSEIADSSIYKLSGMNRAHSQELFCSYAFNRPHPPPGFVDLVERFVRACDGLPLSLKVTGALLCGRDDTYWKELLNDFHKIPTADIRETVKISYNSLDQEYQQIFLDMACFSIGEDMDTAKRIWGAVGISILESKCLLELDSRKRITMHDQVRDMGRYTAAERTMPHRLWCHATNNNNVDKLFEESSWSVTTEVRVISTVHRVEGFHYGFGVRSEMSWYKRRSQELLENCKRALFNTDRYHGLPGKWELLKDQAFDAQVVSIHTGAMEEDQWCEMNFRQAEALVLNFSAGSYFLPSFLSSMTKLKVLIVLNYGSKRATVNGLPSPSSLPQLKTIRLESLNVPSLQEQSKLFQNLEKLSLSLCEGLGNMSRFNTTQSSLKLPTMLDFNLDHCCDLDELPSDICDMSITNWSRKQNEEAVVRYLWSERVRGG